MASAREDTEDKAVDSDDSDDFDTSWQEILRKMNSLNEEVGFLNRRGSFSNTVKRRPGARPCRRARSLILQSTIR